MYIHVRRRDAVCTAGAHTFSLARKELFSKATRGPHLFYLDSGPQPSSRPPESDIGSSICSGNKRCCAATVKDYTKVPC